MESVFEEIDEEKGAVGCSYFMIKLAAYLGVNAS